VDASIGAARRRLTANRGRPASKLRPPRSPTLEKEQRAVMGALLGRFPQNKVPRVDIHLGDNEASTCFLRYRPNHCYAILDIISNKWRMMANNIARPTSLPALTGVRFFAALAVFTFHSGAGFLQGRGLPSAIAGILNNGYLGVSLFFVLSGFILTYTHQNDTFNGRFICDFYVARFARIYPVYLLALLIALPIVFSSLSPGVVATELVMLQAWTPPDSSAGFAWVFQAWTLSVELFFYLCFPAILFWANRLTPGATAFVAAAAAILIVTFGLSSVCPNTPEIPYLSSTAIWIPVFRTAEFVYGVMLCRLTVFHPRLSKAIGGHLYELLLSALILIVLAVATDVHLKGLVTVLVGVLIVQLSGGYGAISAALSTKPLILLGGASYALYLAAGPIRALCEHFIPHPWDRFLSPALAFPGAVAIFLFWEQPCRKAILSAYGSFRNRALEVRVPAS
jgi:peptidoglycan/LPS O-acetylase OafA/YrhL